MSTQTGLARNRNTEAQEFATSLRSHLVEKHKTRVKGARQVWVKRYKVQVQIKIMLLSCQGHPPPCASSPHVFQVCLYVPLPTVIFKSSFKFLSAKPSWRNKRPNSTSPSSLFKIHQVTQHSILFPEASGRKVASYKWRQGRWYPL